MIFIWLLISSYLATGVGWLVVSPSRGFIADLLFALLWPIYLWLYWRHGV